MTKKGKRGRPAWNKTMPEWPLDNIGATATAPNRPVASVQARKSDRLASGSAPRAYGRYLQHTSHTNQLTHVDAVTCTRIPPSFFKESDRSDEYPSKIFSNVTVYPNRSLKKFMAYGADDKYSGVDMSMLPNAGHTQYNGTELNSLDDAHRFTKDPGRIYLINTLTTWYTMDPGRRRVMHLLSGAALLANQGADIGEPCLPAIGEPELVTSSKMWKLQRYPEAATEAGTPHLQTIYRGQSIVSYLGFMAAGEEEVRMFIGTGLKRDETLGAAIDMSIASSGNPEIEAHIGETITRTLLLPDILPTISPNDYR